MGQLTLKNLNRTFKFAREEEAKYVAVVVTIPEKEGVKTIVCSSDVFDSEQEFYNNTYNDDLTHKHVKGIVIVKFTHADSYDEIQALLGV